MVWLLAPLIVCVQSVSRFFMFMRIASEVPFLNLLVALAVVVIVSACSSSADLPPPSFAVNEKASSARAYRLGVGDELKITVFGEENLSGKFKVNARGRIAMPLIGEVAAKGDEVAAFRARLVKKLSDGYLRKPRVSVEVLSFRPIYIHGEVKKGGEYQFKNGVKYRDVVAMAGGYTYRANQGYLIVVREGGRQVRIQMPTNLSVLPGDNIRVPERFF